MTNKNTFSYVIDLDERGSFYAHVENDHTGKTVYSFSNEVTGEDEDGIETVYNGELWITEDGFMKHTEDVDGLCEYLIDMKVLPKDATLVFRG